MELDFLQNLLEAPQTVENSERRQWHVPQFFNGPLRRYETEMRCVSTATSPGNAKNCGSGTFFKLEGKPTCMMHSLIRMNEMLQELEK